MINMNLNNYTQILFQIFQEIYFNRYHDYSPYLRIFQLHVDTKVDQQTMLFFYIQALLLPQDEITEEFHPFFASHPFHKFLISTRFQEYGWNTRVPHPQ